MDLLAMVGTLEGESDNRGSAGTVVAVLEAQRSSASPPPPAAAMEKSSAWVDQARGLSNTCHMKDDDDSDTGLSFMHSQDSDNAV